MQATFSNRSMCTVALFAGAAVGGAGAATRQVALAEADQFVLRAVGVRLTDGKTAAPHGLQIGSGAGQGIAVNPRVPWLDPSRRL